MKYEEYEKHVIKHAKEALNKQGINTICLDKIAICYGNGNTIMEAIDVVYFDTLFWEGKL